MTKEERFKARDEIVQEVNKFKMRFRISPLIHPVMFSQRHIQQAVKIARQWNLVSPATLITAGYNPTKRR